MNIEPAPFAPDNSYCRRTSAGSVSSGAKTFENMRSSFQKKRVESWRNNEAIRLELNAFSGLKLFEYS